MREFTALPFSVGYFFMIFLPSCAAEAAVATCRFT